MQDESRDGIGRGGEQRRQGSGHIDADNAFGQFGLGAAGFGGYAHGVDIGKSRVVVCAFADGQHHNALRGRSDSGHGSYVCRVRCRIESGTPAVGSHVGIDGFAISVTGTGTEGLECIAYPRIQSRDGQHRVGSVRTEITGRYGTVHAPYRRVASVGGGVGKPYGKLDREGRDRAGRVGQGIELRACTLSIGIVPTGQTGFGRAEIDIDGDCRNLGRRASHLTGNIGILDNIEQNIVGGIVQVNTVARVVFGTNEAISVFSSDGSIEIERILAVAVQNAVGQFFELVAGGLFPIVGLMFFTVRPVIFLSEIVRLRGGNPHFYTGGLRQVDDGGEMFQLGSNGNPVRHVIGRHVDDDGVGREA